MERQLIHPARPRLTVLLTMVSEPKHKTPGASRTGRSCFSAELKCHRSVLLGKYAGQRVSSWIFRGCRRCLG